MPKKFSTSKKKIIRLMGSAEMKVCCTEIFRKFPVLPLANKCLLQVLLFVVDTTEKFLNKFRYAQYRYYTQI